MVNFLDYEKLAKGQVFYNHDQVVDFSYILKNKISLYKRLAENKGITVTSSIEDKIFIKADPSALDRVVNNIIDNAIRMEISKSGLKIGQEHVKVVYGERVISKFAKMAFGNFLFILIEGFRYRISKL